jgi:hypothetical protein
LQSNKIFVYEIRRMLFSREYLLLTLALLAYSLFLIRSRVMFGTGYTAPFSQWTFSDYVSSTMVLALILLVAMCSKLFTETEIQASSILRSTPTSYGVYRALRLASITLLYMVSVGLSAGACYIYYVSVFGETNWLPLAGVWGLLVVPSSLFVLGITLFAGSFSWGWIQLVLAGLLSLEIFRIPLPEMFDIRGASLLNGLQSSDQPFAMPAAFILGRCLIAGVGLALVVLSFRRTMGQAGE